MFPPSLQVQRPGFSIGSRSDYWSGFTNAACAPFLASGGKTTCRKSLPSIEFYPASSAAALGWTRHKDGRRRHAQSSLLQRASRRKARSWCSKKALQRPAIETACTGGNQPSVMAAGDRDSWSSSVRKASCKYEAEIRLGEQSENTESCRENSGMKYR